MSQLCIKVPDIVSTCVLNNSIIFKHIVLTSNKDIGKLCTFWSNQFNQISFDGLEVI